MLNEYPEIPPSQSRHTQIWRSAVALRPPARAGILILLLGVLAMSTGCVGNHSFPAEAALDVPNLIEQLEARPEHEDALFDLSYLPLLHLNLRTFGATDDEPGYPNGHTLFDLRAWLPLFSVVDGAIEYYDDEQAVYERNEFSAVLWGLWARNQLTLWTLHGKRVERRGRFLWLFNWGDEVEYARP